MMLTKELVERALPASLKNAVTPELVTQLNNVSTDQIFAEQVRDNFISYTGVLREGKYKTEDYLNAVTFVSYRLMNHTNKDAYFKTFPTRYQALLSKGTSEKDISAYVSAYVKGKLVQAIMEQTLTPSWVLNQDMYQDALKTQHELMRNAVSEKVRCDAANSLLTHLTKPKEAGPLVNIDMRESSGMNELKNTMEALAKQQLGLIQNGMTAKEIAGGRIFEGESTDVSS